MCVAVKKSDGLRARHHLRQKETEDGSRKSMSEIPLRGKEVTLPKLVKSKVSNFLTSTAQSVHTSKSRINVYITPGFFSLLQKCTV